MVLQAPLNKLIPKLKWSKWETSKVLNAAGTFAQIAFVVTASTSLTPLMCFSHPNGERSVIRYPEVLCEGGSYSVMVIVGMLLLAMAVGFISLVGWFGCGAPQASTFKLQAMKFAWVK